MSLELRIRSKGTVERPCESRSVNSTLAIRPPAAPLAGTYTETTFGSLVARLSGAMIDGATLSVSISHGLGPQVKLPLGSICAFGSVITISSKPRDSPSNE